MAGGLTTGSPTAGRAARERAIAAGTSSSVASGNESAKRMSNVTQITHDRRIGHYFPARNPGEDSPAMRMCVRTMFAHGFLAVWRSYCSRS